MSSRPYTAILVSGNLVKVVDLMAPLHRDEARKSVEPRYPGFTLITLVPGIHSASSFSYGQEASEAFSSSQNVDPFDMTYVRTK